MQYKNNYCLKSMNPIFLKQFYNELDIEAGVDEAGRGCLAGPVIAAAVILPKGCSIEGLNDSKKLSENKRNALRNVILEQAISVGIGLATVEEIDQINILNATFLAMHRAIDKLNFTPQRLLIDGNRFKKYHEIPHNTIISGDAIFQSIAAASVIAKTERDRIMEELSKEFPQFCWEKNKGYGTEKHRNVIHNNGTTVHHRKSFRMGPPLDLFSNLV
jgi:ribonuclease HII